MNNKNAVEISIIIVNYNTIKLLEGCLRSLINFREINYEILVIDNSSSDNSAGIIREKYPEVKLIENKENLGFAKANNQGIKLSRGEYVLFLNPDTIVQKYALEQLINFMKKNKSAGAVSPKLIFPDGTLQFSCRRFYNLRTIILRRTILGKLFSDSKILAYHLMTKWNHADIKEIDWTLAACLMVRREVLSTIGYYDERYKMYFEDVDLCWRIKKGGYKIYYYPNALVIHYHQRESAQRFSKKTIWHIQSAIRFFNKYGWKF